ncbi:MAG: Kelch repeat-containing protein, partial [Cyclobacteriaceae bacterium]
MKKINLLYLLLFIQFTLSYAQTYNWKSMNSYPGPARSGAVSFVIGDTAYVGTGSDNLTYYKTFYKYAIKSGLWSSMPDLPGTARSEAVAFSVDGKGYVGTGFKYGTGLFNDFYEYDPQTGQWNRVADFAGGARSSALAFVIDNKAYVGTGSSSTSEEADFYSYDPQSNNWTQVQSLPAADKRKSAVGFSINGKGYVAAGNSFESGATNIFSDLKSYDPVTNSWKDEIYASSMLSSKNGAGVFVLQGKAYLVGGSTFNGTLVYDPSDNALSYMDQTIGPPSENKRSGLIAFSHGKDGYAGLGYYSPDFFTTNYKKDLWKMERVVITPPVLAITNIERTESGKLWLRFSFYNGNIGENDSIVYEVSKRGGAYQEFKREGTWSSGGESSLDLLSYELDSISIRAYRFIGNNRSEYSNILLLKYFILPPDIRTEATSERYIQLTVTNPSEVEDGYYVLRKEVGEANFQRHLTVIRDQNYDDQLAELQVIDSSVVTGKTYQYAAVAFKNDILSDTSKNKVHVPAINGGKWRKVNSYDLPYSYKMATYSDSIIYLTNESSKSVKGINMFTGEEVQVADFPFSVAGNIKPVDVNHKLFIFNNTHITSQANNQVHYYNKVTKTWVKLANKPYAEIISIVGIDPVKGIVYTVFDSNELWSYDTKNDIWKLIADVRTNYFTETYYSNGFVYLKYSDYYNQAIATVKVNVVDGTTTTYEEEGYYFEGGTFFNNTVADEVMIIGGDFEYVYTTHKKRMGYNNFLYKLNTTAGTYTMMDYYNGPHIGNGQSFYVNDTLYYGLGFTDYPFNSRQIQEVWMYCPEAASPAFNFKADSVSLTEVYLSWLKGSISTDYYELYRKAAGQAEYEYVAKIDAGKTNYHDKNLEPNLAYTYKIQAFEGSFQSAETIITVNTMNHLIDISNFQMKAIAADALSLSWKFNNKAPVNSIYILKDNNSLVAKIAGNKLNYIISGLEEGAAYRFKIVSTNSFDVSDTLSIHQRTLLKSPEITGLYFTDSLVMTSWIDHSNIEDEYKIVYYCKNDNYNSSVEKDKEETIFDLRSIAPDGLDSIGVYAKNNTAISSVSIVSYKNVQDITPLSLKGLHVKKLGDDNATIGWDSFEDENADSLKLIINEEQKAIVSKSLAEYQITGLEENSIYHIQIAAINRIGSVPVEAT